VPLADPYDALGRSAVFANTAVTPAGTLEAELLYTSDDGGTAAGSVGLLYGLDETTELSIRHLPLATSGDASAEDKAIALAVRELFDGPRDVTYALDFGSRLPVEGSGRAIQTALALTANEEVAGFTLATTYAITASDDASDSALDLDQRIALDVARVLRPGCATFVSLESSSATAERLALSAALALTTSPHWLLDLAGTVTDDGEERAVVALTFSF